MRCHICNVLLCEPTWNLDHEDWDPCETCKQVIQDTLNQFKDRPVMDEDEFPDEGLSQFELPFWTDED